MKGAEVRINDRVCFVARYTEVNPFTRKERSPMAKVKLKSWRGKIKEVYPGFKDKPPTAAVEWESLPGKKLVHNAQHLRLE